MMIDKLMDAVDEYFYASGFTDVYSYPAVKTAIDFLVENKAENLETNVIDVTETRGVAVFIWTEGKKLMHWEIVYDKTNV